MKKFQAPIILTAASVATLMGATQAQAALDVATTVDVNGPAFTVSGGGVGSGTAVFGGASMTLNTIGTTQTTVNGALGPTATLTTTTVHNGGFSGGGSTFTSDGSGTSTILCTGNTQTCSNVVGGTFSGGTLFNVDTATGGGWSSVGTVYGGLITTVSTTTLTPQVVPLPAAAWLFGSALLGLAGIGRKRKV
jgi:hypothetical protein